MLFLPRKCSGSKDMWGERKTLFPPLTSWVGGHVGREKDAFPTPHVLGTRSCGGRERRFSHPSRPGYEVMWGERKTLFPPLTSWVGGHVGGEKDAFPIPHVPGRRSRGGRERHFSHRGHVGREKDAFPTPHVPGTRSCERKEKCYSLLFLDMRLCISLLLTASSY